MMWQHAKECGVFMWMSDINALVQYAVLHQKNSLITPTARPIRSHRSE
jgi:hypothetical protein